MIFGHARAYSHTRAHTHTRARKHTHTRKNLKSERRKSEETQLLMTSLKPKHETSDSHYTGYTLNCIIFSA